MLQRSPIPALSLWQPWAWLVVHALKPFENRPWRTKYRGPLLIHASARRNREDYEACRIFIAGFTDIVLPPFEELPRGGIVGRAEVTDCIDHDCNWWFTGPHALVLANAQPLPFEPCKASQKFFYPLREVATPCH
jgi:hypothetical protein